jgi:hypothetical protein
MDQMQDNEIVRELAGTGFPGFKGAVQRFAEGGSCAKNENVTNEAKRLLKTKRFCFPYSPKANRLLKNKVVTCIKPRGI